MDYRITGVSERDLDLLLMEELLADSHLVARLFGMFGFLGKDPEITSIRHSASEEDGESDLLIVTHFNEGTKAMLLVENKVKAGYQPRQAERYRERAAMYQARGEVDLARTLLFAPAAYIGEDAAVHGFDGCFTYEALRQWILDREPWEPRYRFKEFMLTVAIERSVKGYSPFAST